MFIKACFLLSRKKIIDVSNSKWLTENIPPHKLKCQWKLWPLTIEKDALAKNIMESATRTGTVMKPEAVVLWLGRTKEEAGCWKAEHMLDWDSSQNWWVLTKATSFIKSKQVLFYSLNVETFIIRILSRWAKIKSCLYNENIEKTYKA